jgi:creatinine amidohydrolase
MERAATGDVRPLAELWPALRDGGVAAVSTNGVLGDPVGASAQAGWQLVDDMVTDLMASLDGWP